MTAEIAHIKPYYSDDLVELYHGDCREVTTWLDADVLVTDPPYGIAWRASGLHSDRALRESSIQSIVGDDSTVARDDVLDLWGDRPAVVFGAWREARPRRRITHRLIWHKAGRKPGVAPAAFFPVDEEIYLLGAGWQGSPSPSVITTTEARERQPADVGHPTPKPLGLMERLIEKCPPGVIAEPFAGSGSTLIAAKMLGRRAIGVELDERYCEIAARRLGQDTLFGATEEPA
jgi:site-specific DNA-methyltransferase (adenine-specific)